MRKGVKSSIFEEYQLFLSMVLFWGKIESGNYLWAICTQKKMLAYHQNPGIIYMFMIKPILLLITCVVYLLIMYKMSIL